MGSHVLLLLLRIYKHRGICTVICIILFATVPSHDAAFLSLLFSKVEIRSFLKANGRLSATWNTSVIDLLLVYRGANHSSIYKTIIIIYILYSNYSSDIFLTLLV